jgi:hypothetical protein
MSQIQLAHVLPGDLRYSGEILHLRDLGRKLSVRHPHVHLIEEGRRRADRQHRAGPEDAPNDLGLVRGRRRRADPAPTG